MVDQVQHVGMQALSLPRCFSDGNLSEWLDRFETCAEANHWDAHEQLARLPTFLDKRAYNLYRRLNAGDRNTMANLQINLRNLFYPPEARETRRLKLCNSKCSPEEEIDQFVYRLERKFGQAYPDMQGVGLANQRAEMLKICFIAGLPDPYQKSCVKFQP